MYRQKDNSSTPPVSCFSSQFKFLPPGDASVCSEKMAAPGEKSFYVLQYHTSNSVITVQREFRTKYAKDPPTDKTIRARYKQSTETGCMCKQKSPMLTRVWQKLEYRIDVCLPCHPWCTHRTPLVVNKKKSVFLWLWTIPLR